MTRLVGRGTHTGSYGGVEATGKPVRVRNFAVWRREDDKVAEISAIPDQFRLPKRIGYLAEDGHAALCGCWSQTQSAGGGPYLRRRRTTPGPDLVHRRYVDSAGRYGTMCRYRGINEPASFLPGPRIPGVRLSETRSRCTCIRGYPGNVPRARCGLLTRLVPRALRQAAGQCERWSSTLTRFGHDGNDGKRFHKVAECRPAPHSATCFRCAVAHRW